MISINTSGKLCNTKKNPLENYFSERCCMSVRKVIATGNVFYFAYSIMFLYNQIQKGSDSISSPLSPPLPSKWSTSFCC